ncbi:tetratricopeptide repeat protein [Candidatus Daviesbacteria bacterium]|nr:tetratricopeptide repeat protein [Candidatus Daviesbacteria bacterium]
MKYLNKTKFQIIIILLFALIPYINIFQNEFVIDDSIFLNWAQGKNLSDFWNIFKGELPLGHEGVYRPIRGLIYVLVHLFFGSSPFWFHLYGLFVHLSASILIYLIATKISKNNLIGFGTALIFASHPIHTETITYISASMEATGLVYMLVSFYLYLLCHSEAKPKNLNRSFATLRMTLYLGSIIFALLAFFTYEMTLTLPLLIVLYSVILRQSRRIPRLDPSLALRMTKSTLRMVLKRSLVYLPYFLGLFFYFLVRLLVTGIKGRAPYPGDSLYITFLAMFDVFFEYLKLIILPINQVNNHILINNAEAFIYRGYNQEPFKQLNILNFEILVYILIYIGLFILAFKSFKKLPFIAFGLGVFFISLLPVLGIVPQGSLMNEKFLYLPSFGIIFLLVWLGFKYLKEKVLIIVLIISLIFSFFTFVRNKDWKDNLTIWAKDAKVYPEHNAYAYFQLGNAYREKGNLELAVKNYQKSYQINPNFSVAFASLAQVYDLAGDKNTALKLYNELLSKDPYFWEAYREIGKIYLKQEKFPEAKREFEKILAIYPGNQEAIQLLFVAQQELDSLPKK